MSKPLSSTAILERFHRGRPSNNVAGIDLTLRPAYRDLLQRLGEPHRHLPPVFHVAGTNGKGSTCAFLRAILEAAGYRVHVYTSPHLVNFHERIRIAGKLIGEDEFVALLTECEKLSPEGDVTIFEALTATALAAFARHPADFTILETGLGGRLDATNIVEVPLATLITRLSYDHREFLGSTLSEIAREKAGIMRKAVPCFSAPQPDAESVDTLHTCAAAIDAPLFIGGKDWRIEPNHESFRFIDDRHAFDLPMPTLPGAHQFENAGLAIAALLGSKIKAPSSAIIAEGLRKVEWPARLQKLESGTLRGILPPAWELWLDGGHNDSAGEVLAAQAKTWSMEKTPQPLHLIFGMIKTKTPEEFLRLLAPYIASIHTITIPGEPQSFSADDLATQCRAMGFKNVTTSDSAEKTLREISVSTQAGRVLICGSLYLAGHVLNRD